MNRILFILLFVISLVSTAAAQMGNSEIKSVLEHFCKDNYADCFPGRKYLEGSLVVTSSETDGTTLRVRGRHNFVGYLGRTYTDVDFKADITNNGSEIVVIFYKWFVPTVKLIDGHWESCEKKFKLN